MKITKGTRVLVLSTGEIGTIAEKQLVTLHGHTHVSCRVVTPKFPSGVWMPRERFRDPVERATITIEGDDGVKHVIAVKLNNDGKSLELSRPDDGSLFVEGHTLADSCSNWFLCGVAEYIKPVSRSAAHTP